MQRRKRQTNIDQFLREGLCPRNLAKSADRKESAAVHIENALRIHSSGLRHHRIEFTESPETLRVSELIDFTKVKMLDSEDAFIGAESGVFKSLNLSKSKFTNYRISPQSGETAESADEAESKPSIARKPVPITAMNFTGPDQTEIVVGRKEGQVDLFNSITESFTNLFTLAPEDGWIKGIQYMKNDRILTASTSGSLAIWDASGHRLTNEDWKAGDNLLRMRTAQQQGGQAECKVAATGGKENPLKLWDLNEQKCTFTAKNVRPDNLELRVPVWVMDCAFLNSTEHCVATSTGLAQIRLYDMRAQRRPILQESWLQEPIGALSACSREWHVVAGNNRGELGLFDLRTTAKGRLVSKYKGFAGAIRSIDANLSHPQIMSCGIDRFAILHNLDSREIVRKIYCKVQLNACLLRNENSLIHPNQKATKKPKKL